MNEIECPPYRVAVHGDGSEGAYLQVRGFEPDAVTGEPAPAEGHGGRKWRLSLHMTRSEIVQTALKAILTYAEHEVRERFTWRGARIFGPHISVEALFKVCDELDGRA